MRKNPKKPQKGKKAFWQNNRKKLKKPISKKESPKLKILEIQKSNPKNWKKDSYLAPQRRGIAFYFLKTGKEGGNKTKSKIKAYKIIAAEDTRNRK